MKTNSEKSFCKHCKGILLIQNEIINNSHQYCSLSIEKYHNSIKNINFDVFIENAILTALKNSLKGLSLVRIQKDLSYIPINKIQYIVNDLCNKSIIEKIDSPLFINWYRIKNLSTIIYSDNNNLTIFEYLLVRWKEILGRENFTFNKELEEILRHFYGENT